MRCWGPVTGPDLKAFNVQLGSSFGCISKRKVSQAIGHYGKLHILFYLVSRWFAEAMNEQKSVVDAGFVLQGDLDLLAAM